MNGQFFKNFLRSFEKRLDKSLLVCYNKYSEREVNKMFYNFENIDDYLFEKAVKEYWDCPEALIYEEDEDEE